MSTASLLRWIALVAGAELAVRGHLANRFWTCHAGALLVAIAVAALLWPTRGRRAGAITAAALLALAAVDTVIGAVATPPPPAPTRERTAGRAAISPVRYSPAPAPGRFVILLFAGSERGGDSPLPASPLRSLLPRCEPPIEVVEAVTREPLGDAAALESALARFRPGLVIVVASGDLLDDVIAELPVLAAPREIGPRGSQLGRALEGALARWLSDLASTATKVSLDPRTSRFVARYRELVLAARRTGSEVALTIPPHPVAPDEPHVRAWALASRAVRALAGTYAIPAVDLRPEVDGAHAVAEALGRQLEYAVPGCRTGPS
jgi:hypothetical protein